MASAHGISNFALLTTIWDRADTVEKRKQLLYTIGGYPITLASYGLDNEESRLIDQFFEVEFPNCLNQAQTFKNEKKNDEADGIETGMALKTAAMIDRMKRMLADKETYSTGLNQASKRKLKSVGDRLTRIERLAPLLQAVAEVNEEEKQAINVFFKKELPACHKEIKKLRDAGREELAEPIEDAMAEKLCLMMERV